MNLRIIPIFAGLFFLTVLSLTAVIAVPTTLGTDTTNDVEVISWTGLTYAYQKGDFKDEIDIVSLSVEKSEGLISDEVILSITFQATPVADSNHLYWVWISFAVGGDQGTDAGAWFYVGGYTAEEVDSFWWVWKDVSNFSTFGTGTDSPSIVSNTLSWTTNATYWDDVSNSNDWEVTVWAWTSDNTTFAGSTTGGVSYWDYFPNDESAWEESDGTSSSSTTTTTTNGQPSPTPGFEFIIPIATLATLVSLPVILRKRRN
ncbi:MAG: Heimdall-CTERM domain-containing surface protein [Promethearchaeota archaeon]